MGADGIGISAVITKDPLNILYGDLSVTFFDQSLYALQSDIAAAPVVHVIIQVHLWS